MKKASRLTPFFMAMQVAMVSIWVLFYSALTSHSMALGMLAVAVYTLEWVAPSAAEQQTFANYEYQQQHKRQRSIDLHAVGLWCGLW